MSQRRLWLAATIIALVILVGFVISVPHTTHDKAPQQTKVVTPPVPSVAVRDGYRRGQHTLSGTLTAPNACATATTTASLAGSASSTERIQLAVSLTNETQICLQLPTPVTFTTTLVAPSGLPIEVRVNGVVASTTLL